MSAYYQDDQTTLHLGDALDVLRSLPSDSVDCCVTSPPYFGLRDYDVEGQLGAENTPAQYVAALVAILTEARRVLAADGTLWLNLGDSYSTRQRGSDNGWDKSRLNNPARIQKMQSAAMNGRVFDRAPKNLLGIPWRVAFGLQDAGWILRNAITWYKPNAMPESVTDRLSAKQETVFLFSKSPRYWFDLSAVQEPATGRLSGNKPEGRRRRAEGTGNEASARRRGGNPGSTLDTVARGTRNQGDVWIIPTSPFPEAHFAAFPIELPRRCIAAGCKPGGVVLDPFSGSGTTGKASAGLGRRYVGIDLNREYLDLSLLTRLAQPSLTADVIA